MINNTISIFKFNLDAVNPETQALLNEDLEKYDYIYTNVSYFQLDYFLGRFNDYSWQIESYYDTFVPSHLEKQGSYYIFEISQGEDKNTKVEWYSELLLPTKGEKEVTGYIRIHPRFWLLRNHVHLLSMDKKIKKKYY